MLGSIWDWIKDHVWLSVGIVVGVIVLWRLSAGSTAPAATSSMPAVDPTVVQAGMQLEAMRMQSLAQSQAANLALQATQEENAAQIKLAEIARDLSMFSISEQADLEARRIDLTAYNEREAMGSQVQLSTLQTAVQMQSLQTQQALANIQAQTVMSVADANAAVQARAIKEANKGLFSKIFG